MSNSNSALVIRISATTGEHIYREFFKTGDKIADRNTGLALESYINEIGVSGDDLRLYYRGEEELAAEQELKK